MLNMIGWLKDRISPRSALPMILLLAGLVLITGCGGGGMSRSDAALFSKALGEKVRDSNYSKIGGNYDPKQAALAEQSGLTVEEVGNIMAGVQTELVGNFALDANFKLAQDMMGAIKASEKLTSLATTRLEQWLLERGKEKVQGKLKEFLTKQGKKELEEMLKVAGDNGLEYGFFAGAGTFWFRDPVTGEFVTVSFVDHKGEQVIVVMEGVGVKKQHPQWKTITNFEVSIDNVEMWWDPEVEAPPKSKAKCCPGITTRNRGGTKLEVVTSWDPNDMLFDPEGVGDAAYISKDQVISYTIRFENKAEASAPAFDVTVVTQLGEAIDMNSVLLGNTSHPNVMTADIDDSNNTITWFFKDIMLPPNQDPPEGEGWINFSAKPKEDTASGTSVNAKSAIRFDFNPPIETNEVIHTVDSEAPVSSIGAFAPVQLSPNFQVPWIGSDGQQGSGIESVTLLVSEDGAPFEVVGTFTEPLIPFQGEPGKTYGFATIGVDYVGNPEVMPETVDAKVTVGQRLAMDSGWHLVGVPVVTEQSPRDELARPGTRWSTWDATTQSYQTSDKADARWLANSQELPGAGLWANFEAGTNFYVTGEPLDINQPFSIELAQGWNLIANPFALPVAWSLDDIRVRSKEAEKNLAEAQVKGWVEDFAWGWDGESYFLVYDSKLSAGESAALQPFQGYWVQAHQDVTLVLPPPDFSRD